MDVIPPSPRLTSADALCFASARDLAQQIRSRKVSAREVMTAFLAQIARLNPKLNAIVAKLDDEVCLKLADKADHALSNGGPIGVLHGLPTAFKDLEPAVGFPQSKGSPIFRDFMPDADSAMVARIRRAGAVPIGKTNVPELGMGSQTYNKVYGTTLNAYDRCKDRGRIERRRRGGARGRHVADRRRRRSRRVAPQSRPISTTSWRLRPSVGLVPVSPTPIPFVGVSTKGAMARSVADVAFGLSVMAGADVRDQQTWASDPKSFAGPLDRDWRGTRVAWSLDLGGLPVDAACANGSRSSTQDLRGSRLHRRGCVPGLRQRQRNLSDAADLVELGDLQGSGRRTSVRVQAGGDVGHRVRRAFDR